MTANSMTIGLTGLACAGKSAAAAILAELGALVIDVDQIGHETLQNPLVEEALYKEFGPGVFDSGKRVNRKALGCLVFADAAALHRLEQIVHPVMCDTVRQRAAAARDRTIVIDAAILHYLCLDRMCDRVILITAPFETRLERARLRHWTEDDLTARDEAFRTRLPDGAQFTEIENAGALPALQQSLTSLWKELQHA